MQLKFKKAAKVSSKNMSTINNYHASNPHKTCLATNPMHCDDEPHKFVDLRPKSTPSRDVDTSCVTGVRAFMMIVIALGHMNTDTTSVNNIPTSVDLNGGAAVACFFSVSGFLMTIAYGHKDFSLSLEKRNFWIKRFIALAPMYYASLFFSFPAWFAGFVQPRAASGIIWKFWLFDVPATLLCLQSWVLVFSWNYTLW